MKHFTEIVQDFDATYYANMTIGGLDFNGDWYEPKLVKGLPEYVDYKTLCNAIKEKTGIEMPKRDELIFQQSGRKKYAYVDATQYLGKNRGCCSVTFNEMIAGHTPNWGDSKYDIGYELDRLELLSEMRTIAKIQNKNYTTRQFKFETIEIYDSNEDEFVWDVRDVITKLIPKSELLNNINITYLLDGYNNCYEINTKTSEINKIDDISKYLEDYAKSLSNDEATITTAAELKPAIEEQVRNNPNVDENHDDFEPDI